jgi:hypothetical protein
MGDIVDDITPATRRMTYAEIGRARGISARSAERLVQRRRWLAKSATTESRGYWCRSAKIVSPRDISP